MRLRRRRFERPLVYLDRAATGGLLWIALATAAGARRRDAGVPVATARNAWIASLVAHVLARAVDRKRPLLRRLAIGRLREPSSPSFPSRHAATAFAGATTLGLGERELLPALVVLAATIAGSRVYRGLHYPSDAAAGAVVGTAVSAADRLRSSGPRR